MKFEAVRAKTQRTLIEFLEVELELGRTFAQSASLAKAAEHMDHYASAKEKATVATESVRRFISQATDGKIINQIGNQLAELSEL